MQSVLGAPMARFVLGAVTVAVLLADGIVLVGLAGAAHEVAPIQSSAPDPALTPPARPAETRAPGPVPLPTTAPTTAPGTVRPRPAPRETTRPAPATTRRTRSPFEDRCRAGEIPSWLCRDLPR